MTPSHPLLNMLTNILQVPNPPGSRLRAVQGFVKRWVGLSPVLVTGAGLFRGWRGILPLRRPVATVGRCS